MKRPETKGFSSSSNMFFAELSYKKQVPWIPVPKKPKKELSSNTSISSFRKKNHPFRGWLLGPYPSIGWWFWMLWSSGGVKDEAKLLFWFFPAEIKPYKNTKRNDFAKVPRFLSAFFFSVFFRVLHMLMFEISQQLGVVVGIYVSNALDLRLTRLFWRLVMQLGGPFQPCGPGPGAISKWAKLSHLNLITS